MTYRDAGVDLDAADRLVERIRPAVTSTWGRLVVGGFGGFAAGIKLPPGYADPVLMMTTDGVGTKAEVARRAGMIEGLGYDLVAMCVDDLAAVGARPLALTDYLAVGQLDPDRLEPLVRSIAAACSEAGVALLGGETAEHPGVMEPDEFDLAAAALGVVDAGEEVTGEGIGAGDAVIGVASPNLRSNGFSLVRTAVVDRLGLDAELPGTGRTVAEAVLAPSVIYAPAVLEALLRIPIAGLAHITGGGIAGNLVRVLPEGVMAAIDTATWTPPAVFDAVAEVGGISHDEMFRTFNMGIGFVTVTARRHAERVIASFGASGHEAWQIGEIELGPRSVRLV